MTTYLKLLVVVLCVLAGSSASANNAYFPGSILWKEIRGFQESHLIRGVPAEYLGIRDARVGYFYIGPPGLNPTLVMILREQEGGIPRHSNSDASRYPLTAPGIYLLEPSNPKLNMIVTKFASAWAPLDESIQTSGRNRDSPVDLQLNYPIAAGVGVKVSSVTQLTAGYRSTIGLDPELHFPGYSYDSGFRTHEFVFGARFSFE